MKQILITLFLAFALSINTFSQSYSQLHFDQNIEKFVNWEIKNSPKADDDKKKVKYINRRIADWFGLPAIVLDSATAKKLVYETFYEQCKEYLDDQDFEYITDHFYRFIATKHTKGMTVSWNFEFENAKRTEKLKKYQFYNYTVPLFSSGNTYVLIQKNFLCGPYCESSCIYLYKNMGPNYWVLVKQFNCWFT